MKKTFKLQNQLKTISFLLLLFFPFFCLLTGSYFRSLLGDLSIRSIDPDYVYFSNGLGVSLGNLNTGNIFHPGSPLQYFAGIIFRLVYLIRSPEATYIEDIFTNPDLYMSVVSFSFIGLLSVFLFAAGWYVYRITQSILSGILIQTTPFLPVIWYDLIGRVTPEVFQSVAVLALALLVIKYYLREDKVNTFPKIVLLAFVSAFGLSAKVTFLPLLVIPVVIIPKWKNKIAFLAITFLFFLLMAVSVLLKIEVFWNWIKNIFLHSGDYGGGQSTIIDLQQFKVNLINLVQLEKFFFQVVLLSILILVVYLVLFRKKAKGQLVIYTSSIILAIVIHLVLVSKHFAHRNYLPSLLLMPLLFYFTTELVKAMYNNRIYRKSIELFILIFILLILKNQLQWLPIKSKAMESHVKALEETRAFVSTLEDESIKIITSQNYGAPFKEYALLYSTVWSAHSLKPRFAEILEKLYPNTYQYTTWDDRFQYWSDSFSVQPVIQTDKNVYLYIERDDVQLFDRTIAKLKEVSSATFSTENELLYRNPVTTEVIYRLRFHSIIKVNN